jgi:hypothetical protein
LLAVLWIVWAAIVLWHSYVLPADWIAFFDGELLPAPFWREAARRSAAAVAGASVVTLAAWAAGAFLFRAVRATFTGAAEGAVFTLAAGFAAVSFALFGLAASGLFRPAIVSALAVAGALAGAAELIGHLRRGGVGIELRRPTGEDVLWVVVASAACACALVAAFAPETEYDALWYHLWLPQRWLDAGRPVDLVHEYPSLYPQTWELLFGAAMTIGGPVAAKLLHFVCLPLIGVTTALLASALFPQRRVAAAASALAIVSPTVIWEATTAYIDLALAWYVTLGVHALVRHANAAHRQWLTLSAASIGVAMAIKHLGLVAFAIVVVALAVVEVRRGTLRGAVWACVLFSAVALLPPAPHYLRAYAASGNPVFPDLYGAFGAAPPARWDAQTEGALEEFKTRFGRERTLANIVWLPWDVTTHSARYRGTPGPVFLLLAPLGLLAGAAGRWILLGCAAYALVWASPISSFQFRFLIPALPLLAMASAAGLRTLPRAASAAVGLLLVLNLPPFTHWHERDKQGWTGWLTHVVRELPIRVVIGAESERSYLSRSVPAFAAWEFANARLPADARVLTFFGGDHLYSRRDRLWSDTVAARPATWGAEAGREREAFHVLEQLGITHVLLDTRLIGQGPAGRLAVASVAARQCCLEELYTDGRSALYRVR